MERLDPAEWDRQSVIANKAAELGVSTDELEKFFERGHEKVPKLIADMKKKQEAEKCQAQE